MRAPGAWRGDDLGVVLLLAAPSLGRIGVPVRVHYETEGNDMLVDRVILDED